MAKAKRKKIRRRRSRILPDRTYIKPEIKGRPKIPENIYIECIRVGKKKNIYYKKVALMVCIVNYNSRGEEIDKIYPDCVNCKNWMKQVPGKYNMVVFGTPNEADKPKVRKRKKIRRKIQ